MTGFDDAGYLDEFHLKTYHLNAYRDPACAYERLFPEQAPLSQNATLRQAAAAAGAPHWLERSEYRGDLYETYLHHMVVFTNSMMFRRDVLATTGLQRRHFGHVPRPRVRAPPVPRRHGRLHRQPDLPAALSSRPGQHDEGAGRRADVHRPAAEPAAGDARARLRAGLLPGPSRQGRSAGHAPVSCRRGADARLRRRRASICAATCRAAPVPISPSVPGTATVPWTCTR